ncbi:hypothetical protein RHGRI_030061 [Rhododendron griersonianum]|uniref:RING-type E3 ubiquitin transferase n=1 Tax=Rhododendron griersonianum TaxID=479676 RepID=A0AAV6IMK1_9ERIC|nr:hypothetical protein RHGRI_030061 [Rhododendron griersonianum]
MTKPIRSIHYGAPALHGDFHRFLRLLFLLSAAAAPTATAQMSANSSSSSGSSYTNANPSMAIIIAVLFVAFLFMFSLSVYIHYCNPDAANSGQSRRGAAARQRPSKPGLDPEVIESFPIFQYSDVKDLKFGKGGGTLECAVCIAEFEYDDALRLLPKCDHVFHPECIDAWLASHSTCPVCRANLAPSQNELGQGTELPQSNDSDGAQNPDHETQISVDVEEGGNRGVQQVSETPKRKLPKSYSTGHSLSQPGENLERYTLRLPVELRREMMNRSSRSLKRAISCVVVLPTEASSRRGGGEGSSIRGRSDRNWRSDRWVFTMTPLFFSRSVASPKMGSEGDLTAVGGFNRSFLTNVRTPFDCLAVKSDGVGQTSTRPPV